MRSAPGSPPNGAATRGGQTSRATISFHLSRLGWHELSRCLPAHPWPVPSALGLAAGIVVAAAGLPAYALAGFLPLAWFARPLLLRRIVRPERDPAGPSAAPAIRRGPPASTVLALLLPLLAAATGWIRFDDWRARPDPFIGMYGTERVLSGRSDGRVLDLDAPPGARVAISPAGSLPPGRVELRGLVVRPSGRSNPGGFDYRGYLLRRGIHAEVLVGEVLSVQPERRLVDRLREGVRAGLPAPAAALAEAMTLGVRSELGPLRETFAAAGLAHVLALSGLHVGVLLAAAGRLLTPLGLWRYPALLALDLGYVSLVGASPSVVRAALMAAVVVTGLWLGSGRVAPWPCLGVAALVTLLLNPAWAFDLSLQLSYGSVAGILLFAVPLARRMAGDPRLPWWHPRRSVVPLVLTSASAQAGTVTLVADAFGALPLFSPLVNLVAIPVATLLVPVGFLSGLLGLVSTGLAVALNTVVTAPLAALLLALADSGATLPALVWGEIEPSGHLYYTLALTALALAANGRLRLRRAMCVLLLAATLSAATPPAHPAPELVAIDVGQGDSFVLRFPGRVEVLVDGGGTPFSDYDVGAGVVVPALRALGVDELELVVATHADTDHMEGLASVLRAIPVQLLVYGVAESDRPVYRELMDAAGEAQVPVRSVARGELIVIGDVGLEVLNPPPGRPAAGNDGSVALAVSYRGVPRALLLGDVAESVEREIVPPQVDVLVAPHHGSAHSSSSRLLALARPKDVVVSVGRNRYGHPSPAVLRRIERVGATAHLTSELGAVRLPLGR